MIHVIHYCYKLWNASILLHVVNKFIFRSLIEIMILQITDEEIMHLFLDFPFCIHKIKEDYQGAFYLGYTCFVFACLSTLDQWIEQTWITFIQGFFQMLLFSFVWNFVISFSKNSNILLVQIICSYIKHIQQCSPFTSLTLMFQICGQGLYPWNISVTRFMIPSSFLVNRNLHNLHKGQGLFLKHFSTHC